MTIVEVLKLSTEHLDKHGSDSPRLDAELLLAHALGVRRLDLYLRFDHQLSEAELASYRSLIARRAKREPVAYVVGRKEFMGLDFIVTPSVLVPNPDTEVLVQLAVGIAREAGRTIRVADIGTGSGCIAIAVAHYATNAEVWATDVSREALDVAALNVSARGLQDRVHLVCGDMMDPLSGSFDLVCANLPYIAPHTPLSPEVVAQPAAALYSEQDGAGLVIRLLEEAAPRVNPEGRVLGEIDPSIMPAVVAAAGRSYTHQRVHRDLGGRERVIEAWS